MALYKAKESYKTAKNKFFGIHKIKILEQGGSLDILNFKALPESVQSHLEPLKSKKKKKKGDK